MVSNAVETGSHLAGRRVVVHEGVDVVGQTRQERGLDVVLAVDGAVFVGDDVAVEVDTDLQLYLTPLTVTVTLSCVVRLSKFRAVVLVFGDAGRGDAVTVFSAKLITRSSA